MPQEAFSGSGRVLPCAPAETDDKSRYSISPVVALSQHTGVILAEVGFLLIVIAGIWLVAAQIAFFKIPRARTIVAGTALAAAGVLLLIATHWGHFD
jgi:hypothetical protein